MSNKLILTPDAVSSGHLENFAHYLRVQRSNQWNMFSSQAIAASGLDRDDYLFIMANYEVIWNKYQELHPEAKEWRSGS